MFPIWANQNGGSASYWVDATCNSQSYRGPDVLQKGRPMKNEKSVEDKLGNTRLPFFYFWERQKNEPWERKLGKTR